MVKKAVIDIEPGHSVRVKDAKDHIVVIPYDSLQKEALRLCGQCKNANLRRNLLFGTRDGAHTLAQANRVLKREGVVPPITRAEVEATRRYVQMYHAAMERGDKEEMRRLDEKSKIADERLQNGLPWAAPA